MRPSGFLLLLSRTFDAVPLGFYSDRSEAEENARARLAAYDPHANPPGRPIREHGCLGEPDLISRVQGIKLIHYVDGEPVEDGRCYFSHEWEPVARGSPGRPGHLPDPKFIPQEGKSGDAPRRARKRKRPAE